MKKPAGTCRYCGSEFMSKQSLKAHEEKTCKEKPEKGESERWRKRAQFGNNTIWVPRG